ncbi:IS1 family transposase [Shigella sonnei]|nr:IS1 family transposase [Shigella sonnei]
MASVSISCPSCSATDGVVRLFLKHTLRIPRP